MRSALEFWSRCLLYYCVAFSFSFFLFSGLENLTENRAPYSRLYWTCLHLQCIHSARKRIPCSLSCTEVCVKSPGQRASAGPNPTLFSEESPVIRDPYYGFRDTLWRLIGVMTQSLDTFPGIRAHYLSSLLGGYSEILAQKSWRPGLAVDFGLSLFPSVWR